MNTSKITIFKILTLAIVLTMGLSFAYAWTAPTARPPKGNIAPPVTTSTASESKAGFLTADGGLRIGMTGISCDDDHLGTLRWNTPKLEVCVNEDLGEFDDFNYHWKEWPSVKSSSCNVTQLKQACSYVVIGSCNCGKDGCDLCRFPVNGVQYQAKFVCQNQSDITSGWSVCGQDSI